MISSEKWNDDDFLIQVKELARLQFLPAEIAIMLSINTTEKELFDKVCRNETEPFNAVFTAYNSGKLEEEILIRKAIMLAAKQGSPPAQTAASKLILNNRLKERGR